MHEISGFEPANLRYHEGQQGIGGNVERDTQEAVGTALVELTAQTALRHIELENGMTGHQGHGRQFRHIPGADDQPAAVGGLFDLFDQLADLVHRPAIRAFPAPPLLAIDRAQVAFGIGPLIPDTYPVFVQVADVGISPEEPEKFINDAFQMQLLGGHQGEPLRKVEPHLVAKTTDRTRSGPVRFRIALVQYMLKEIQVLLHGCNLRKLTARQSSTFSTSHPPSHKIPSSALRND